MCRIAGLINPLYPIQELQSIVQQMCDLQKHGGPDDEGLYTNEEYALVLGNRRLALLDLTTAGHQPMQFQSRYWITYNGELYNFKELKKELIHLGHSFKNHTDTEVILAAYAQWQTQSFKKLRGMFSFCIWDNHAKELTLVRDPAGIKPLYYSTTSGGVSFASEVRAFEAVPHLRESNKHWPVYLMAYGHIPESLTTLQNVQALHKGSFLKYSATTGKTSLQSFKHYSFSSQVTNTANAIAQIKTVLNESVRQHLVADTPVGVFLSGGLDSSILATEASAQHRQLNSLSIHLEDQAFSEKKFQDILVKQLTSTHHPYLLQEAEFHQSFPQILDDMDMPSCDGINTWFISKQAAGLGLKAVLSGLGGDELFGGYPSFKRMPASIALQRLPVTVLKSGKLSRNKKVNRLAYLGLPGVKGKYLFLRGHFTPNEIARQLSAKEAEIWTILAQEPVFTDISNLQKGNQASWIEFNMYMQNQLLRDADVMSMIHGVEIRVPMLDTALIELAFKIQGDIKYSGQFPKQLLIDAYRSDLPSEIWNRPKMGFSFPFSKWLRNSTYVKDLMNNGNAQTKLNYASFMSGNLHWSHMMSIVHLKKHGLA